MLNWVVVGVGDITTKRVMPAIREEAHSRLYGVVSRTPEKGRGWADRVWTRLEDALNDPEADAVYVATPVVFHAPQAIAALRAGKHVLCEKPMAMNHAEAVLMADTADAFGKTLGVAYYRRMYPKLQRAKALIREGRIGRPVLAEINCHGWFTGAGPRAWLADPAMAGGGPLYDVGSHRIDVLNFLFGRPQAVTGHMTRPVQNIAVEDCATVLIEYEDGMRGIVDVRWHCRVERDEFRIIGTEGEMELSPLNGPALCYPGGEEQLPAHANLHYPCVENFVRAVLDGGYLFSSGRSAQWTDWVTERAVASSTARLPLPG
jgi:predicted dehydrogenase